MMALLNNFPYASDWLNPVLFPLNRWLHIVATTTLVGGVFFYEFVIPKAIEDLNGETQLAVLGRVRWIFRKIVIFSAITMVVTGAVSTWRLWPNYHYQFEPVKPWWAGHVFLGVVALAIAVRLTISDQVPRRPFIWLRVVFVVMLVSMFAASVARHVRLSIREQWERYYFAPGEGVPYLSQRVPSDFGSDVPSLTHPDSATTQPSTAR